MPKEETPSTVMFMTRLPAPLHEALRRAAFERRGTMTEITIEALVAHPDVKKLLLATMRPDSQSADSPK